MSHSMYIECPRCHALFRARPDIGNIANGWACCGECGFVFNINKQPEQRSTLNSDKQENSSREPLPTNTLEGVHQETRSRRKTSHWSRNLLLSFVLLLILILGGFLGWHYALSYRNQLAQYTPLRPWLERMCQWENCTLPPRRDLAAITLLERKIYANPDDPKVLIISATLINRASFPQPWPIMRISFSNLEGKLVALGRFKPVQYLPKMINPNSLMPSKKPVHIRFAVSNPGEQAISYEFSFQNSQ